MGGRGGERGVGFDGFGRVPFTCMYSVGTQNLDFFTKNEHDRLSQEQEGVEGGHFYTILFSIVSQYYFSKWPPSASTMA